jgi:subtilisin family serine protease
VVSEFPEHIQHHSGRTLTLVPDRVLLETKGAKGAAGAQVDRLKLVPVTEAHPGIAQPQGRMMKTVNSTTDRRWLRTSDGSAIDWSQLSRAEANARSPVQWAAPVYRIETGAGEDFLALIPYALVIQAQPKVEEKEFASFCKRLGLTIDQERSRSLPGFYYCVVRAPGKEDLFDLFTRVAAEKEVVRDVRFETMPMFVPTAFVPNDPLFVDQWDMEQIRAGGTGQTGWNIERGDADVIICVLDAGCDLTHPDLVGGYTPAPSGINLGTMGGNGGPTGNHGTACAGIAAARNNNGEGVAGVAGGCTILPVAFVNWTDVEVAAGITYATDEGARVISMSFGWDPWDPAIIDPAIQYAFDANVVMCVATHNYNDGITYPATNPLVIAVGASDQVDNRKSPASPDGETWWGSNFGPEISVVAPGVLCPSTDRQGGVGYNTSAGAAGNYVMNFNGTSAATPHVAGLAALLISEDGSLSNAEVRAVIESTADKVGTVAYAVEPGHPNGTWNEQMGYGRINVYEALTVVRKRCELDFKRFIFDDKRFIIDKSWHLDDIAKLRDFKEKERIDEVKGLIGYEIPEFDPRIYEEILVRLERLEQTLERGRPFIRPEDRPPVGEQIGRRAQRST